MPYYCCGNLLTVDNNLLHAHFKTSKLPVTVYMKYISFIFTQHKKKHMFPGLALWSGDSPLTVRCTQLPLWKVSYCCSSIRTLHSYQPWSSERTGSICREAFPCRDALPGGRRGLNKNPQLSFSSSLFKNTCMLFSGRDRELH